MNEAKLQRKSPGLEDPYEHAPLKPDGDPWAILLKPEMEADKIRCDAWKEEVQTLLIFAGLFSAVVTAFLTESYKFLQPDPNTAIISLLAQIANGLDTTTSSPSPLVASAPTALSLMRTPCSVRINVFWFISLILSLTTVLFGTIGLQWLREHQSYPGFSSKETLAILQMRSQALNAWYVPQLFATFPLLLQGALVLFLAGLIDFTLPLGTNLAIPIACIIGLILLFLAATIVLPSFQALCLLSRRFSHSKVPTPCAYKSPQSQIFHTFLCSFLYFLSFAWPRIYLRRKQRWMYPDRSDILPEGQRHLFPYIYTIWHDSSWSVFDMEWLSLRDAWHNGILDHDEDLYSHRDQESCENVFPLSDITQCLVSTIYQPTSAKHAEEFLVATYYCFQEISASVWNAGWPLYFRVDRRSNYFEKLQDLKENTLSNFLVHGGKYEYSKFLDGKSELQVFLYFRQHHVLFHLDQIYIFLDRLLAGRTSVALDRYRLELKSRIILHLLENNVKPLAPITEVDDSYFLPVLFLPYAERNRGFTNLYSVNLLTKIFERLASSHNEGDLPMNPMYTHNSVPDILDILAGGIVSYLQSPTKVEHGTTHPDTFKIDDIGAEYISTFSLVTQHLNDGLPKSSGTSPPSLVFYYASILLWCTVRQLDVPDRDNHNIFREKTNFQQGFAMLFKAVRNYKERLEMADASLKMPFKGKVWFQSNAPEEEPKEVERFSEEWWDELFCGYDHSSLHDSQKVQSPLSSDIALQSPVSDPSSVQADIALHSPSTSSICLDLMESRLTDIDDVPLPDAEVH